ncbi:MAG: membrane protein insertase YidC [Pseudomonadota bacterium]|nr:membrane protein insertase YidC [Pseudomonadota bacterium]
MQRWGRVLILLAMLVTAYLLVLAWQKDYGSEAAAPVAPTTTTVTTSSDVPVVPVTAATTATDIPVVAESVTVLPTDSPVVTEPANDAGLIQIETDVYRLWVNPRGGDVVRAELLQHRRSKNSDQPFLLLEEGEGRTYVAQSGLVGANGPDAATEGRPLYQAAQPRYVLAAGQSDLIVPLTFDAGNGVEIVKTFELKAGEYPIRVNHRVINRGEQAWQGLMFGQIKRDATVDPSVSSQGFFAIGTFLGGAWGIPDENYNKMSFSDFTKSPLNIPAQGGWVAMVQHYFVSAWVPDPNQTAVLESRTVDGQYIMGFRSPTFSVAAGKQMDIGATLYAGPKIQSELKHLADGLNKTVDYGWLWPIAQLLFIGLNFFYGLIGNWGWAIIVLTIVVKIILYPLSDKSYRSMGKMRIIAPEMQRMKEEFGDDRMRFSQEMMAMYKREQVNPLAGCLPLLLQMPIFLALYWVLMESVELRHAPWLLWITDLSAMDKWFILPLIMGVTMYIQQMLNPQPADPMQAKVLRMLPLIFTVFLLFFPAGLVLYWIVNNLFTIGQQWFVNKQIEKDMAARKAQAS